MTRRRKTNTKKYYFLIFITIIVIIAIIYLIKNKPNNRSNFQDEPDKINNQTTEKISTINMIMVGDALINDLLYTAAYDGENYDFKPFIKYIKEKVSSYDVAYYNQETILGGTSIGLSSYPSFNSPQEFGDAMVDAGFNLVSLATNHTLDRGEQAIILSREYWNNQQNVHAVGSYLSNEEKDTIENTILEKNNIKYAILNYTYGTNGIKVPDDKEYLVNLWSDTTDYENYKTKVKQDIESLRDKVDILIVAMHWGIEYTHEETDIQTKTANYLASLGVDIIIGTHPHVIEPVKKINNTIVFYSLGNFISSQTSDACTNYKCNVGLMSSLTITKSEKDNETNITIDNIQNELIYTYQKNYDNYLVIPFSNPDIKNYLEDYQKVYDTYSKIILSEDKDINLVPLAD